MAVRGGAGLFDVLPLPYQFILLTTQAAPFFQYTFEDVKRCAAERPVLQGGQDCINVDQAAASSVDEHQRTAS